MQEQNALTAISDITDPLKRRPPQLPQLSAPANEDLEEDRPGARVGAGELENVDGANSLQLQLASAAAESFHLAPSCPFGSVPASEPARVDVSCSSLIFFKPVTGNLRRRTITGEPLPGFDFLVQVLRPCSGTAEELHVLQHGPPMSLRLSQMSFDQLASELQVWKIHTDAPLGFVSPVRMQLCCTCAETET